MAVLPGFDASETAIDERMLDGAEQLLGLKLPAAFRQIALAYDGSYGDAEFPLPDGEHEASGSIGTWLSFLPWARGSVWTWLANWEEHALPRRAVPIAENGCGDLLCLDYRNSDEPVVSFWFHELGGEGLYPIAADFPTWLATVTAFEE